MPGSDGDLGFDFNLHHAIVSKIQFSNTMTQNKIGVKKNESNMKLNYYIFLIKDRG